MSTVRQERGVCYAHAFDGSSYAIDRAEHDRLKQEWMAGKAFFEGIGLYGQPVTFKIARIEGLSDFSPEHYAVFETDEREAKQQEMLNGGDS